MAFLALDRQASGAAQNELMPGIRPVTLLIASGIVLITAILIVTGLAAGYLRDDALTTTRSELTRLNALLAEAGGNVFRVSGNELRDISGRLRQHGVTNGSDLSAPFAAAVADEILRGEVGQYEQVSGFGVLGPDGKVISSAGTWPAAMAGKPEGELLAALRAASKPRYAIGTPISEGAGSMAAVPLAYGIEDGQGELIGAAVALLRPDEFIRLYRAVALPEDARIELLRSDGLTLAAFGSSAAGQRGTGEWLIQAKQNLADFPASIVLSRVGEKALANWARQAIIVGAFALVMAIAIGVMVHLIARQFRTHAALSEIQAENIEMERARLAAEAELLKAERLSVLGQLTATVAHELRNPLSAIRNTLFTIKELAGKTQLKFDRPIARIERSIERCDRIIADLLEYTRSRELSRKDVPFDRWVAEVLSEQQPVPSVVVEPQLQAGQTVVTLDPDRFRRVVINLVDNAAQAFAEVPPDREKRIVVRSKVAEGTVLLSVEDNGPGIAPDNLTRIFEPLFSTKSFGTGLGLPTVKQIVNQHGGTIEIDSVVGHGTTVRVTLPLAPEPAAPAVAETKVAA